MIYLTGDRPTGPLHIGHFFGSLQNRLTIQENLQDDDKFIILVADLQALTDNYLNYKDISKNIIQLMKDYIMIGLNPEKIIFIQQSQIPEISQIFVIISNFIKKAQLERNPTLKQEIQQKSKTKFKKGLNVGFYIYPAHQIADIITFGTNIVPVGEDQLPMIEDTNDLVEKFNNIVGKNVFNKVEPLLSEFPRIKGLDGNKMSKSLGNTINLNDNDETIKKKILEKYIIGPGRNIDKNNGYDPQIEIYLKMFCEDKEQNDYYLDLYENDKLHVKSFKINYLIPNIIKFLNKIKRVDINEYNDDYFIDIIKKRTLEGKKIAENKFKEVVEALDLCYSM